LNLIHRAFHNVLRDYKNLLQENQRTYPNGIFHSYRNHNFFFWQLEMFAVCTTGDMAHIDKIFNFLPGTLQHVDAFVVARTWISYRCVPCHPWCTQRTSQVKKKNSFLVAVNNSIKVGPFGFLVINVCNRGEHYEAPCTKETLHFLLIW